MREVKSEYINGSWSPIKKMPQPLPKVDYGTDEHYFCDRKKMLVEKIKGALIELIQRQEEFPKVKMSAYLAEKLHYDYTYLSNIFSEITGSSIRGFLIANKLERVKQLLVYEDLTLSEIAFRMQYSSVAYLSNQFTKNAGQTPSRFRSMMRKKLTAQRKYE